MYCVFNATTTFNADTGNPLGWPLEKDYGYFCDQRDRGKQVARTFFARAQRQPTNQPSQSLKINQRPLYAFKWTVERREPGRLLPVNCFVVGPESDEEQEASGNQESHPSL